MKKEFQTWLNSMKNIIALANLYPAIIDSFPAFKEYIISLISRVKEIESADGMSKMKINGSSTDKKIMKGYLCNITWSIISRARSYAQNVGDNTLRDKLRYSNNSLERTSAVNLGPLCKELRNIVDEILSKLENYNVTPADIILWDTAIANFDAVMNAPRMAVIERREKLTQLSNLFNQTMFFIRQEMDPAAAFFKDNNFSFYTKYLSARRRTPYGDRHSRLNVLCTDELNQPLYNVTVSISGETFNHKPATSRSAITKIDGTCAIESFVAGIYNIEVSGANVQTKSFGPFEFNLGKEASQVCVCTPAFTNITQPAKQTVKSN